MEYREPPNFIQGWLHPVCAGGIQAVLEIQEESNVLGDSLEIGVYLGKTLSQLALFRREGEVTIGIDPFMFTYGDGRTEDIYNKAVENIKALNDRYKINGKTRFLRGLSSNELIRNELTKYNGKIRIASVDGSHYHKDVLNDLCLMDSLLTLNGVVIIDDFCNPINPEVTSALKEFLIDSKFGKNWQLSIALVPPCSPKKGASRLFINRKASQINYQELIAKKVYNSNIKGIKNFITANIQMFDMDVFVMMLPS